VESDASPGMNRLLGYGYITKVAGVGAATIMSVTYTLAYDRLLHHNITMNEVTPARVSADFTASSAASRLRSREDTTIKEDMGPSLQKDIRSPTIKLIDSLKDAYSRNRGKGWRRAELGFRAEGKKHMSTAEEQQLFIEIILLENYISDPKKKPLQLQPRDKQLKQFKVRKSLYVPLSLKFLVQQGWGLASNYAFRLKAKMAEAENKVFGGSTSSGLFVVPESLQDNGNKPKSVIDDAEMAERLYTAEYLYSINECRVLLQDNEPISRAEHAQRVSCARKKYNTLDDATKERWEMKRREQLLRQPNIKNEIIAAVIKNPKASWTGISGTIGNWCSAGCIQRWMTSRDGYSLYTERVIPLLSDLQKKSHLEFSKLFRSNWGLGGGKYLLVHYDEKWFWGLVLRRGAKACAELGIEPHTFQAYHKSHINKTMGVAFVAFAFEDNFENGGEAMKLAFFRAQSNKVADREQRQATHHPPPIGIKYDGPVIRKKGDTYLVDCCVTGSTTGTATDPKFPLKLVFSNCIFPQLDELTRPGGQYEGYKVVVQGDNAGPHQDAEYLRYVRGECETRGWHWKPQAPQMPHMNVLDLSVFPAMSRRHIQRCRETNGLKVLSENEIWSVAEKVWEDLPSCKIASGFVQANRIAKEVIKNKGSNSFLGTQGTVSVGIRKDFKNTDKGLARVDRKEFPAPV
jgi:hypothetical protein